MTAEPNRFEAEFDDSGRLLVPAEAAARLSAHLGHDPRPGDKITLAVVDEEELQPEYRDDVEQWLRTEVVASIEHMRAHPEENLTSEEVRQHFAGKLATARAPEHG